MTERSQLKPDDNGSNDKDDTRDPASPTEIETWLEDHGDYLFAFALKRIKNSSAAEDLVQETLLTGIKKFSTFEGRSTVRTWLTGILKLKVLERLRSDKREPTIDDNAEFIDKQFQTLELWSGVVADWTKRPDAEFEGAEFQGQFRGCLEKLKEKQRLAFTFYVVDELDSAEICRSLAISDSNLWTLLYRARMGLRECLEKNWFNGPRGNNNP